RICRVCTKACAAASVLQNRSHPHDPTRPRCWRTVAWQFRKTGELEASRLRYGLVRLRLPKKRTHSEFAMRIVLHRDVPDDPLLHQQWNALVQKMERPEVFYTHQWALAVRRAYGESLLPSLVLAYEGEELAGVAALATDPAGRTASFLCSTSADYCDRLRHPDYRANLLGAVLVELCRA